VSNQDDKSYSVWVGDMEVNDHLLSKSDAERVAFLWVTAGYDDVIIHNTKGDK
jgi:hypothetical protein